MSVLVAAIAGVFDRPIEPAHEEKPAAEIEVPACNSCDARHQRLKRSKPAKSEE